MLEFPEAPFNLTEALSHLAENLAKFRGGTTGRRIGSSQARSARVRSAGMRPCAVVLGVFAMLSLLLALDMAPFRLFTMTPDFLLACFESSVRVVAEFLTVLLQLVGQVRHLGFPEVGDRLLEVMHASLEVFGVLAQLSVRLLDLFGMLAMLGIVVLRVFAMGCAFPFFRSGVFAVLGVLPFLYFGAFAAFSVFAFFYFGAFAVFSVFAFLCFGAFASFRTFAFLCFGAFAAFRTLVFFGFGPFAALDSLFDFSFLLRPAGNGEGEEEGCCNGLLLHRVDGLLDSRINRLCVPRVGEDGLRSR